MGGKSPGGRRGLGRGLGWGRRPGARLTPRGRVAVSGEQGQAAQRRVADRAVGLGVAPERSPRGPLDPLRGRGAEHPPARPGFPGAPQRDLREVGGPGEREGRGEKRGTRREEG